MPYVSQSAASAMNALAPATLHRVRRDGGRVNKSAAHVPTAITAIGACHTTSSLRLPEEANRETNAYSAAAPITTARDASVREPVTYMPVPATNSAKLPSFPS